MPEYQHIVDEIQRTFYAEHDPPEDELRALHEQYVRAVSEVNGRLRQCDELLQKGLRNEALQLCDGEPNLLDLVSVLDFPERGQWADYVQQFHLPAPPELLIDVAADLNEAYSAEQPLVQLMRRHRLHALARSSLRRRIALMRQIARLDRDNPIWTDDLHAFEKARHSELPGEVAAAVKKNDLNALSLLEQEVKDPAWLEPPSKPLVDHTVEAHTRLRVKHARAELEQLEKQLTAAFAGFDGAGGRKLRDRWNARAAIADLKPDDPLLELAAPALNWLAEEDRKESDEREFNDLLGQLERALDESAGRDELERLSHAAFRFERELPTPLARRLADRLDYLDVREARKNRLLLGGVVMAVLLVGSLTGLGIVHHLRSKELDQHVAYVQALLDEEKFDEVRQALDALKQDDPEMFAAVPIRELETKLHDALNREQSRQARRAQALRDAEIAGLENPSFDNVARALETLQTAADLSKSEVEQLEVSKLRGRIQEVQLQLQQQVDERFSKAVDGLRERLAELEPHDLEAIGQLIDEGTQIERQAHVTSELKARIGPVLARLHGMRDTEVQERHVASSLANITAAVGNRQQFRVRLERYVQDFPTTKRAEEFDRVVKQESEFWKQFDEWQTLAERVSRTDLTGMAPKDAAALAAEINAAVQANPGFPAANRLAECVGYLESVAARADEQGDSPALSLAQTLNNPTVSGLYMVEDRTGRRYYCQIKPVFTGGACTVSYFNARDLKTTGRRRFTAADIANPRQGDGYQWEAPQSVYSRQALDRLAKLDQHNWEQVFTELILNLQDVERMDACLKVQLLQEVLRVACRGSLSLRQAFAGHIETLDGALVAPDVNWLDPDNADAQTARVKALAVLRRLEDAKTAADLAAKQADAYRRPQLGPEYRWLGWLHRDRSRQWTSTARAPIAEREQGDLFVLFSEAEGSPVQMRRIGVLEGGLMRVELAPEQALVEGRPVYAAPMMTRQP